jgi:hypothetical protein
MDGTSADRNDSIETILAVIECRCSWPMYLLTSLPIQRYLEWRYMNPPKLHIQCVVSKCLLYGFAIYDDIYAIVMASMSSQVGKSMAPCDGNIRDYMSMADTKIIIPCLCLS